MKNLMIYGEFRKIWTDFESVYIFIGNNINYILRKLNYYYFTFGGALNNKLSLKQLPSPNHPKVFITTINDLEQYITKVYINIKWLSNK